MAKDLFVDPTGYASIPAVAIQNDFIVTIGSEEALVENRKIYQILNKKGLQFAKIRAAANVHTDSLKTYARIIKPNQSSSSISTSYRKTKNLYEQYGADDLYPDSELTTFEASIKDVEIGDAIEYISITKYNQKNWLPLIHISDEVPVAQSTVTIRVAQNIKPNVHVIENGKRVKSKPRVFETAFSSNNINSYPSKSYVLNFKHLKPFLTKSRQFHQKSQALQIQISLPNSKNNPNMAKWFHQQAKNKTNAPRRILKSIIDKAIDRNNSQTRIITNLLKYVQDKITTLPTYGSIGSSAFVSDWETQEYGMGIARDKSILLKALLEHANIKALYVLTASKQNKPKLTDTLTPASFDGVILALPTGSSYIYLDPSQPKFKLGELSPSYSKRQALLLDGNKGIIVTLP